MVKKEKALAVKDNLSEVDRLRILKWHAEGKGNLEILALHKEDGGVDITANEIKSICVKPSNKPYIERFREQYLSEIKSVPVANKKVRLVDFQRMRDTLFSMVEQLNVTDSQERKELMLIFRRINEVLSVAREEMEGKPHLLQQINITELSGLSDDELQRQKERILAKATGTYVERAIDIGEDSEGTTTEDLPKSSEVPLASPS